MIAAAKQTVATTSKSRHYDRSKGKRGRDDQDKRGKHEFRDSRCAIHHDVSKRMGERVDENPRWDSSTEKMQFTLPPSQLFLIVQCLQGFEWPRT